MGWQDILKQWDWEWLVNVFREGVGQSENPLGKYRSWKGAYIQLLNLLYEGDKDKIGKYIDHLLKAINNPTFSKIRIAKIKIQRQPELFLPPVLREAKTVFPRMIIKQTFASYYKDLPESFYINAYYGTFEDDYYVHIEVENMLISCDIIERGIRDWKLKDIGKLVGENNYMYRSYYAGARKPPFSHSPKWTMREGPFITEEELKREQEYAEQEE